MNEANERDTFDERLSAWLKSAAEPARPDLTDRIVRHTVGVPQRRRGFAWGLASFHVMAGAAAVVLAVVVGLQFAGFARRDQAPGAVPTATTDRTATPSVAPSASATPSAAAATEPPITTPSPSAAPTPTPSQLIAFAATDENGTTEVWVMNADGSDRRQLTESTEGRIAFPAAWSPDGTQVAFHIGVPMSEAYAIGFVHVDGTGQREVVDGIGPSWSPDGTQLLYQDAGFSGTNVRVLDLPDGEPRALGVGTGPQWSPDGTQVAFTGEGPTGQPLMVGPTTGEPPRAVVDQGLAPQWSPDGTEIAYFAGLPEGGLGVYVVSTDLFRGPTLLAEGEQPRWSPDGSRIAFVRADPGSAEIGLWVMAADGSGEPQQLPVGAYDFAWSPDGMQIAVGVDADGDGATEIHVMAADGSTDVVIGPGDAPIWQPAATD